MWRSAARQTSALLHPAIDKNWWFTYSTGHRIDIEGYGVTEDRRGTGILGHPIS